MIIKYMIITIAIHQPAGFPFSNIRLYDDDEEDDDDDYYYCFLFDIWDS